MRTGGNGNPWRLKTKGPEPIAVPQTLNAACTITTRMAANLFSVPFLLPGMRNGRGGGGGGGGGGKGGG